jgi:transcriptional regulator with PAS, ATPase and Fis domain
MSFDISNLNKKKMKNQKNLSNTNTQNGFNEITSAASIINNKSQTNRVGLRVYKIVILGDGGVGKSGKYPSQHPN